MARLAAIPRVLFFDVFATLVDWRSGVAREAEALLSPLGYRLDWLAFADAWRAEYQPATQEVRAGNLPYVKLDALHRRNLERVLQRRSVPLPEEATLDSLNRAWHRLDAWPDVAAGLARLERKFWLAPVSNGHIALMVALARRNGFLWSAVLGAALAGDYKPKPRVYERACEAFDLAPGDCMMVADAQRARLVQRLGVPALEGADQRLYEAKHAGRGRVVAEGFVRE